MTQKADQQQRRLALYLKECLDLLVWLYFKPFTLQRWQSMLPPISSQSSRVRRFLGLVVVPAQRRRFFNQIRSVTTALSLLIGLLYGLCLSLFSASLPWLTWIIIELCFSICIWFSVLLQSKGWRLALIGVLIGLIWLMSRDTRLLLIIPEALVYGTLLNIYINWRFFLQDSEVKAQVTIDAYTFKEVMNVFTATKTWAELRVWAEARANVLALRRVRTLVWIGIWVGAWALAWTVTNNVVAVILLVIMIPSSVYVWLFEYLWACLLYVLSRRGQRASWLRYLPYRLDEAMWLPLPFMASLIAEAYQDNPALTQETIEYLNTSTSQRHLVAQVTRRITLNQLERCQTTSEIADVANRLDWIPLPAPKELEMFLPRLLEVSQGVRAALSASSSARQAPLLKGPATSLRKLQTSVPFSKYRYTRTIGRIVQQWISVVETAQTIAEERAQREGEIPQVYVAGNALDPDLSSELFKGRRDLFREIETLVLAPQPPILFLSGGRRAGKTSALKYLPKRVGPEFVPLLVDLQGAAAATTLSGLAEHLAKQIQKAARQGRAMELPAPDFVALRHEPFLALQTWFESLERRLPDKRFVLCLDEFERLDTVLTTTGSHAPLHFLRHLFQHHPRWIVLFSGSHTPNELAPHWTDYLINTRTLSVSYLQEPDARDLILHPAEDFPQIYEHETVDLILELTHCHPYLIQLLCSILVNHLNRAKRQRATPDDVRQVLPKVFEEGSMFFREFWHSLTLRQQQVAVLLVQGKLPDPEQGKETIRSLVRRDIIKSSQESYRFQVPLYELYIKQMETDMD